MHVMIMMMDIKGEKTMNTLETAYKILKEGYVRGVDISKNVLGETKVNIEEARITLKGAQYLHENSAMQKFMRIATNVITIGSSIK